IAANKDELLLISGTGEVITPDEGVLSIGSGGNYALAAARALMENTELSAQEIAVKALRIASSICVYTNDHIICEVI
ncbi:MAG: HslU--HslV peptidase proteolytic subunit, partial [Clostridia bacterium]|nr:HslU--HslV peptidase proteolytic subunit [Clostridia bacterium]